MAEARSDPQTGAPAGALADAGIRRDAGTGLLRQIWRRFARHRLALAGLGIVVLLVLAAALAPVIAPTDPERVNPLQRHQPPFSPGHLLGTDEIGRDVLTRLLYAGRVSLTVGFAAMVVTIVVGSCIGVV